MLWVAFWDKKYYWAQIENPLIEINFVGCLDPLEAWSWCGSSFLEKLTLSTNGTNGRFYCLAQSLVTWVFRICCKDGYLWSFANCYIILNHETKIQTGITCIEIPFQKTLWVWHAFEVVCTWYICKKEKQKYLAMCFYHVAYTFTVNLHSVITWMSRNSLLEASDICERWVIATGPEPRAT